MHVFHNLFYISVINEQVPIVGSSHCINLLRCVMYRLLTAYHRASKWNTVLIHCVTLLNSKGQTTFSKHSSFPWEPCPLLIRWEANAASLLKGSPSVKVTSVLSHECHPNDFNLNYTFLWILNTSVLQKLWIY